MNHYNASSQEEVFWKQADFGFLKERLDEMTMYCEPEHPVSEFMPLLYQKLF